MSITSWNDFKIAGAAWNTTVGNVTISNSFQLSLSELNSASTNMFRHFDAIMDFQNNTIQIVLDASDSKIENALICDLSGGTIKNLILDVRSVTGVSPINFNQSVFKGGILVKNNGAFNPDSSIGSYGTLQNITCTFGEIYIYQTNISLILPPYFGNKQTNDITFDIVTINGEVFETPAFHENVGLLGIEMLNEYSGTFTMIDVTNEITTYLNNPAIASLYLIGKNFGKDSHDASFNFTDCTTKTVITAPEGGGLIDTNAFINASNCTVTIQNCYTDEDITSTGTNAGLTVGSNCFKNATNSSLIVNDSESLVDSIILGDGGGFFGSNLFDGATNCKLSVSNHTVIADISANDAGGIFGKYFFKDASNCTAVIDTVDISINAILSGSNIGGIFGSYALDAATNSHIEVTGVVLHTDISANNSGGIFGPFLNNSSKNCTVSINNSTTINDVLTKLIKGENSGGFVGPHANNGSNSGIYISNCTNNFDIDGLNAGGIIGSYAGDGQQQVGHIQIKNCKNTGVINKENSGGIAGSHFGNESDEYEFDDYIYIIGGKINNGGETFHHISRFDGTTVTSLDPVTLNIPVFNHSSLFYKGKIHTVGGQTTGSVQINEDQTIYYNIDASQYETAQNLIGIAGIEHTRLCTYGNKMFIIGGVQGTTIKNNVWIYNGAELAEESMHIPRIYHSAHEYKNKIYVIGGTTTGYSTIQGASNVVDVYDVNTWALALLQSSDPLLPGITKHCSVLLKNKICIFGGIYGTSEPNTGVIIYDIDSNSSTYTELNMEPLIYSAAESLNNRIYIFGGENVNSSIYEFNQYTYEIVEISSMLSSPLIGHSAIFCSRSLEILNCENTGDLNVAYIGGCVGTYLGNGLKRFSSIEINNFTNDGMFLENNNGGVVASHAGLNTLGDMFIYNCDNNTNISQSTCGGIISSNCFKDLSNGSVIVVEGCSNNGPIDGNQNGGIAGMYLGAENEWTGSIGVRYCRNDGNITGEISAGIVGPYLGTQSINATINVLNCENVGNLDASGASGIVGAYANSGSSYGTTITIDGCANSGDLLGISTGGIVGYGLNKEAANTNTTVIIQNCFNEGAIKNLNCGGIIAGKSNNDDEDSANFASYGKITILDCSNQGLMEANTAQNSGGIAGNNVGYKQLPGSKVEIINCTNNGELFGDDCAGIIGSYCGKEMLGDIDISNCVNYGSMLGDSCSGIVGSYACEDGKTIGTLSINTCYNYIDISGPHSAGILGKYAGNVGASVINILNCENSVSSFVVGPNSAGIVGEYANYDSSGIINIVGCINRGTIQGDDCAGIIGAYAGALQTNTAVIDISNCENVGDIAGDNCSGIIGKYAHSEGSGLINIHDCINSGDMDHLNSAGIVGEYAGNMQSGEIIVENCHNYGTLLPVSLYPDLLYDDLLNTTTLSGIIGRQCNASSNAGSHVLIQNCVNHDTAIIYGDCYSGIIGLGINYDSSGVVDISGCANYGSLNGEYSAGICAGMIGIDQTGTVKFTNCTNNGDISNSNVSGIINTIGHNYNENQQTSGEIKVISCVNNGDADILLSSRTSGIIGTILLSSEKDVQITIENCTNKGENIESGIVNEILDISASYSETTTNNITIDNCSTTNYALSSDVINKITSPTQVGSYDTNATITIQDCELAATSSVENSHKFIVGEFGNIATTTLKNKDLIIRNNSIVVIEINGTENVSMLGAISYLETCNIDISQNLVIYTSIVNSDKVSGIMNHDVHDLSNCSISIHDNDINIDNIDTSSQNIAGIHLLATTLTNGGSYSNTTNTDLSIIQNTITSTTPEQFVTESNGPLFGTIELNANIPQTPGYNGPSGVLTIENNTLSAELSNLDELYFSDLYMPDGLRPYIFQLIDISNSRFWWNNASSTVDIPDGLINPPQPPQPPQPPRIKTDDTNLRNIFRRAIAAINEQTSFEIYPFYHLRVKADQML